MSTKFIGLYSANAERLYGSVKYVDEFLDEYIVTCVFGEEEYREGCGDIAKPSVFENYRWSDAKIVSRNLVKYVGKAFEGEKEFDKTVQSFAYETPIYPKNFF